VQRWSRQNDAVSAQQVPGGHCFMQERPEAAAQAVLSALRQAQAAEMSPLP